MLPPFIIEQIRKREERQRQEERPELELPLDQVNPAGGPSVSSPQEPEQKPKRGVIVVDL